MASAMEESLGGISPLSVQPAISGITAAALVLERPEITFRTGYASGDVHWQLFHLHLRASITPTTSDYGRSCGAPSPICS